MCGFFTMANVISLELHKNPVNKAYHISEMRSHKRQLLSNAIIPFSNFIDSAENVLAKPQISKRRKTNALKIKLYLNPLQFPNFKFIFSIVRERQRQPDREFEAKGDPRKTCRTSSSLKH